jgi:hypothetical protein
MMRNHRFQELRAMSGRTTMSRRIFRSSSISSTTGRPILMARYITCASRIGGSSRHKSLPLSKANSG